MRRIKGPCPGCGKPEQYRPADKVCQDCAEALEWAADEKKRQAARKHEVIVRLPWASHALAYLHGAMSGGRRGYSAWPISSPGDVVRRVFWALLHDLSRLVPNGTSTLPRRHYFRGIVDKNHYTTGEDVCRAIDARILGRLLALYRVIMDAVDAAQKDGKHDGLRFTTRLATGELTAAEYNKAILEEGVR